MEQMWTDWIFHGKSDSPLKYAAVRTLCENDIVRALALDGEGLRYVPLSMQTERMARASLQQTARAYYYFNNPLRGNRDFARLAIQGDCNNYTMVPKVMQDDPEMLLLAMISNAKKIDLEHLTLNAALLEEALALAATRASFYAACRMVLGAGALRPGPLKLLRGHGIHFLRQFNQSILAYAGLDALIQQHYQVYA